MAQPRSGAREEVIGRLTVRLRPVKDRFGAVVLEDGKPLVPFNGDDADKVWAEATAYARSCVPGFHGWDGAIARFLRMFPAAFADPRYATQERGYKDHARTDPRGVALEQAHADPASATARANWMVQATNLLFTNEKIRLREVLSGRRGPAFVAAAAAFASGDRAGGLSRMASVLRDHDVATWPAATYLPFLWRPETEMFLKPMVTRDFAARIGHPFAHQYGSELTTRVYDGLLALASEIRARIDPAGARDNIDAQSFLWVCTAYDDRDAPP